MQLRSVLQETLAMVVFSAAISGYASAQTATQDVPSAPAPASTAPSAPKFPPVDANGFTAASPTLATVEGFLKTS